MLNNPDSGKAGQAPWKKVYAPRVVFRCAFFCKFSDFPDCTGKTTNTRFSISLYPANHSKPTTLDFPMARETEMHPSPEGDLDKQAVYNDFDIQKLEDILEEMDAGIWRWHIPSGRTHCSSRWSAILGYPLEELSPSTIEDWADLVYEGDRDTARQAMATFLEGQSDVYSCKFRMHHREGHLVWVRASGIIMARDEAGNPLVAGGLHQDISEQKRAMSELKKIAHEYEKVFEGTQSSMFLTEVCDDGSFRYVRTNRAYERTSGFSPLDTIGKTPQDLYGEEQGDIIVSNYRRCLEKGSTLSFEADILLRGNVHTVMAELTPVYEEGRARYIVGSSIDISDKKKIMDDLVEARNKAEASDHLKTAFLNNISHEIRTPLNGILGFGQLLAQDASRQQKSHLHNMQISSQRLMDTINKITDISMILSGTLEVNEDRVMLPTLLQDLRERFHPLCQEEGLELLFDEGASLRNASFVSDGELLYKALSHLVDNAVKFTQEGKVVVRTSLDKDRIQFSVEDTGIGIVGDYLKQLYQPFSQEVSGITRGYEGSGLGLSIAKGIVELLGGRMGVQSEKFHGTTFTVFLPAKELHLSGPSGDTRPIHGDEDEAFTVLIADDDPMARFLAETLLEEKNVRMLFASDGQEAVEVFQDHPEISIVLMDVKMPVLDGLSATEKVKKLRPAVPVIAITAYAMSGDEARIKAAGCDDYISKPFSKGRLFDTIKKHLPAF